MTGTTRVFIASEVTPSTTELEKSAAIRHHCALSPSIMAPFCGHGCPWRITVTDAHERLTDRSFKVARNEYFCD